MAVRLYRFKGPPGTPKVSPYLYHTGFRSRYVHHERCKVEINCRGLAIGLQLKKRRPRCRVLHLCFHWRRLAQAMILRESRNLPHSCSSYHFQSSGAIADDEFRARRFVLTGASVWIALILAAKYVPLAAS